jgi:sporulation protein YlmC with PRC-barrel domain
MKITPIAAMAPVLLLLLAAPAWPQDTGTYRELEDAEGVHVGGLNMAASELEEMDLYGPDGEQVGEVEEVLVDTDGAVVGVAVETEGFLGLGDEDVVMMLNQISIEGDRLTTRLTEEEIEDLPEWDD